MALDGNSIGEQVRLLYANGTTRGEGRMVGFSMVPQVLIKTHDGKMEWWRHDMAEVIPTVTCPTCGTTYVEQTKPGTAVRDSDGNWDRDTLPCPVCPL